MLSVFVLSLKAIDASVIAATFNTLEAKPYTELYLHIVSSTLKFADKDGGKMQSKLKVKISFATEFGSVMLADSFFLASPVFEKGRPGFDLVDVRRYPTPPGKYKVTVALEDQTDLKNTFLQVTPFEVFFPAGLMALSSIQLLDGFRKTQPNENDRFCKSGMYLQPRGIHFYGRRDSVMSFYTELYEATKQPDSMFMERFFVESTDDPTRDLKKFGGAKKLKAQPVGVMVHQLSIKDLPSGNYRLVMEICDRQGKVMARRGITFQRSNPSAMAKLLKSLENKNGEWAFIDTLPAERARFVVKSLGPSLPPDMQPAQVEVLREKDPESARQFIKNYLVNLKSDNPKADFYEFLKTADYVETQFTVHSGKRGYSTDRGYVYLRYGIPSNLIDRQDDFSKLPYQIWEYNSLFTGQSQVVFVFYNPTMVPGDYRLLHSDARGEISNPNWKLEIARKSNGNMPNSSHGTGNTNYQTGFDNMDDN